MVLVGVVGWRRWRFSRPQFGAIVRRRVDCGWWVGFGWCSPWIGWNCKYSLAATNLFMFMVYLNKRIVSVCLFVCVSLCLYGMMFVCCVIQWMHTKHNKTTRRRALAFCLLLDASVSVPHSKHSFDVSRSPFSIGYTKYTNKTNLAQKCIYNIPSKANIMRHDINITTIVVVYLWYGSGEWERGNTNLNYPI